MKNLLFISTYPFPLNMGSSQHAYFFLKALSCHFNIYCVFFIPPYKIPPADAGKDLSNLNIKDYQLCYFNSPSTQNKYARLIRRISSFPGHYMNLATNSEGIQRVKAFINKYSINIVHFEHFHYVKYAFHTPRNVKKVIVYHDLHHSIYRQMMHLEKKHIRKLLLFLEFVKYYVFEKLLDRQIHAKIFLNPLEMLALPKNSIHIPHIANPEITFKGVRETNTYNILFLGAYNHPPNRVSVKFISEHLLPEIVKTKNRFKIHIVGPDTEKFEEQLSHTIYNDSIIIRGFVKDINKAFEDMDIALFPILYGGGIKTKVIDAMASGLPVVTTPHGIIGLKNLPQNAIGVGTTVDEILGELSALMKSHSLRLMRSKIGKGFVDKQHSFKAFSEKIEDAYPDIHRKR